MGLHFSIAIIDQVPDPDGKGGDGILVVWAILLGCLGRAGWAHYNDTIGHITMIPPASFSSANATDAATAAGTERHWRWSGKLAAIRVGAGHGACGNGAQWHWR